MGPRSAQTRGYHVLLDAAAYAPTSALSLAQVPADFVAISFYKMFGYPSGVGALLARRQALAALERRYFAGGTVQIVSVQNDVVRARPGSGAFEDGTPNFLAMPAVCDGLRWLMRRRHGGHRPARAVDDRRHCWTGSSHCATASASTGPPTSAAAAAWWPSTCTRDGRVLDYEMVEAAARERGVAIRGGCFCNPGAAEHAFGLPAAQAARLPRWGVLRRRDSARAWAVCRWAPCARRLGRRPRPRIWIGCSRWHAS